MNEYPKVIETKAGTCFGQTVRRLTRVGSPEEERRVRELDAKSVAEADELQAEAWSRIRAIAGGR